VEKVQFLRLVCYDVDDLSKGLEKQDLIGETTITLSEVVTAPGQKLIRPLHLPSRPGQVRGVIGIEAEEVQELHTTATIGVRGCKNEFVMFFV
jgi:hypothetical protein